MPDQPTQMTKEDACAYRERYRLVNEYEIEELQRTSMDEKLRQLSSMMTMSRDLGWTDKLAEDEEAVRERWIKLRKAYAARHPG